MSPDPRTPVDSVTIRTTPQQDAAVEAMLRTLRRQPPDYNFYRSNCAQVTSDILRAAGVDVARARTPRGLLNEVRQVRQGRARP